MYTNKLEDTISLGLKDIHSNIENIAMTLWTLNSINSFDSYKSPWLEIGADLWEKLIKELSNSDNRHIASEATKLSYADCVRMLLLEAPNIYKIVMDIKGLVIAANIDNTYSKNELPGKSIIYDDIDIYK